DSARNASETLRRQLEGMKAKVAEARRNLATLSARKRAADFRKRMESTTAGISTEVDDNAFAKFERLKNRVEQAEAEAEALAELRGGETTPREELDTHDADVDVAAELDELKRKHKR
ncbi:MAG TPA: PspA/IM30 family protein, partial [Pirellulales bacterium]|nr:PspA/IM30 family protein [Pirellulales bacterium]